MSFDANLAEFFLSQIFCRCPRDEWVSVFAIDRTASERAQKVLWGQVGALGKLVKQVAPLVGTHCIWYGVATRKERLDHGRGGIDDCAHLPVLFADIDLLGPTHKANGYPPDEDAVRRLLDKLPRAHLVVKTGGGYHPYWVLREPLAMPTAADVLHRWGRYVMQAAKELGYKVDDVFNVDRILRLAGSENAKDVAARVPVTISTTL